MTENEGEVFAVFYVGTVTLISNLDDDHVGQEGCM